MNKLNKYLAHAAECRELARIGLKSHKHQLEQMAETWEQLAEARKRKLEKQGKSDNDFD
jgi:hypothetical protein